MADRQLVLYASCKMRWRAMTVKVSFGPSKLLQSSGSNGISTKYVRVDALRILPKPG